MDRNVQNYVAVFSAEPPAIRYKPAQNSNMPPIQTNWKRPSKIRHIMAISQHTKVDIEPVGVSDQQWPDTPTLCQPLTVCHYHDSATHLHSSPHDLPPCCTLFTTDRTRVRVKLSRDLRDSCSICFLRRHTSYTESDLARRRKQKCDFQELKREPVIMSRYA